MTARWVFGNKYNNMWKILSSYDVTTQTLIH